MAKKRERIEIENLGGELVNNPFAALGGGTPAGAPPPAGEANSSPADAAARGKLVVRFEAKGHGGKTVTRVSGLERGSDELESLARELRKAMGTGARVQDGDVLVQGKLVDRVAEWFEARGHSPVVRGN